MMVVGSPFFGNFLAKEFFHGSEDLLEKICFIIAIVGCCIVLNIDLNNKFKDQYSTISGDSNGVDAYPTFIDVGGFTDSGSSF
jgi:hypothetical protein